jgi:hypothetical protein
MRAYRTLDVAYRPVFQKLEITTFRKMDVFPSSGECGGKTPTQLGPLEISNSITGGEIFLRDPTE